MRRCLLLALFLIATSLFATSQTPSRPEWRAVLDEELPVLGHRNWIVIVDSAYPLQSSPGVETIETGEDHLAVVDYVLGTLQNSTHVRPLVHTDKELEFVPEKEAPGVSRYREELKARISGFSADAVPNQILIDR